MCCKLDYNELDSEIDFFFKGEVQRGGEISAQFEECVTNMSFI